MAVSVLPFTLVKYTLTYCESSVEPSFTLAVM